MSHTWPELSSRISAIEHACQRIEPQFRDRLQFVAGDFFTTVPEGGDGYILKAVLHDWQNEDSNTLNNLQLTANNNTPNSLHLTLSSRAIAEIK